MYTITGELLSWTLPFLGRAVPRRTQRPDLLDILIGPTECVAHGETMSVRVPLETSGSGRPIVVPYEDFKLSVRGAPLVRLSPNGTTVEIETERTRGVLPAEKSKDFRPFPSAGTQLASCAFEEIARAIVFAAPAVADGETSRYAISNLILDGKRKALWATDGRRLHHHALSVEHDKSLKARLYLPDEVALAIASLPRGERTVFHAAGEGVTLARVLAGEKVLAEITWSTAEGDAPNVDKLLSETAKREVQVVRETLETTIQDLSVEKRKAPDWRLRLRVLPEGALELDLHGPEPRRLRGVVKAADEDAGTSVFLNPRYVVDAVRSLRRIAVDLVTIGWASPETPVHLTGGAGHALVMPITVEEG